jgi:hypothetical protein
MAATKKGTNGATSEDTTMTATATPSQGEAAATQANGTSSDGISVDALADGQLEVNFLDIGVSAEDIAAMRWKRHEELSSRPWKQSLRRDK